MLFPSPEHLPDPEIKPQSPTLAGGFSTTELWAFLVKGSLAAAAKSFQSCPTLCDPIDGSPPGSPVPGILQARILEWAAISFSKTRATKEKIEKVRLSLVPSVSRA